MSCPSQEREEEEKCPFSKCESFPFVMSSFLATEATIYTNLPFFLTRALWTTNCPHFFKRDKANLPHLHRLLVFPPEERFLGCALRIPRAPQKGLSLSSAALLSYSTHGVPFTSSYWKSILLLKHIENTCSRFTQVQSRCYNNGQPFM